MASFDEHPTVVKLRASLQQTSDQTERLSAADLRDLFLKHGADDVGFVSIDRPELDDQRDEILAAYPRTKTLVSFVCRMHREPVRSVERGMANLEFHSAGEQVNDAARNVVGHLERQGIWAVNPAMGFPMEMSRFPGKVWTVSHKPIAVAAGLGQMGIHRNVIHPRFGNFILLGTVLVDAVVDEEAEVIDYNPCVDCKLCVAACPVGAIAPTGSFNFASCFNHNYREFMSGFSDWTEGIASSKSVVDYRNKFDQSETASMWQSLSFGANYKAAYCLSVCPAGEDVMSPFLQDRGKFVADHLKPLQAKEETLYVLKGSDAEAHAQSRFPHKSLKYVGPVLRPTSIEGFIKNGQHAFQPGQSKGLNATYHFEFTGEQPGTVTMTIADQKLEVREGLVGDCDLKVTADSRSWIRFLGKETGIVWLLITRRVKLKGDPRLLVAFGKCFP